LPQDEPKPEVVIPDCPSHLDRLAKQEFKRITAELVKVGLITRVDRTAISAYCVCYSRWVRAENEIRDRLLVESDASDEMIKNPYLSIANKALEQMNKLMIEFGMTPVSRTRCKADQAKSQTDTKRSKLQAMIGGLGK
jgi:P27 family predicted phage terminase small subunit